MQSKIIILYTIFAMNVHAAEKTKPIDIKKKTDSRVESRVDQIKKQSLESLANSNDMDKIKKKNSIMHNHTKI